MSNNYLDYNNQYGFRNGDILDDIDDDLFLNSSSRSNSNIIPPGGSSIAGRSTNPFDEHNQEQIYAERRRQIEHRTLNSTQKSLGLLYETEEVGKATAVELAKQREQLENTSRHLDEINSSLRFSQRHLNSLKSVFGGLKNYLSGNRGSDVNLSSPRIPTSPSESSITQNNSTNKANTYAYSDKLISSKERYDNHPISKLRDDNSQQHLRAQMQQQRSNNPFESQLEANLEEMCGNLSRLKGLAGDLGTEIESQNELLDNMNYKIEDVDLKMTKQNKEMNKILGKK